MRTFFAAALATFVVAQDAVDPAPATADYPAHINPELYLDKATGVAELRQALVDNEYENVDIFNDKIYDEAIRTRGEVLTAVEALRQGVNAAQELIASETQRAQEQDTDVFESHEYCENDLRDLIDDAKADSDRTEEILEETVIAQGEIAERVRIASAAWR